MNKQNILNSRDEEIEKLEQIANGIIKDYEHEINTFAAYNDLLKKENADLKSKISNKYL